MIGLYVEGFSPLHRLWPGAKIAALALVGSLSFLSGDWRLLALLLVAVLGLYRLAGIGFPTALKQVRPLLWVLALLFAVQLFVAGWQEAAAMVLRLCALVLLAALVSLTTRVSDMIAALERACAPLARFGADPERIGLALSMALRFIPVIAGVAGEVREAQKARGMERSLVALATPVVIRTLAMADHIADAIEARS